MAGFFEIEATIAGRVQMVMYRDFARRHARRLGIVGFVRNNKNGSVTVVAQSDNKKLQDFIEILREGPFFAKVSKVEIVQRGPTTKFRDFSIQ